MLCQGRSDRKDTMMEKGADTGQQNQTSAEADVECGLHAKEDAEETCCFKCCGSLARRDLKHFDKFVDTTATHGIRRIFTGKSKCRRLFWLLLVLASSTGCLYNIGTQIVFLAGAPTSTTVKFERVQTQDFPAVTICNLQLINYTRLVELYGQSIAEFLGCAVQLVIGGSNTTSNITKYIDMCKSNYSLTPQQLKLSVNEIFQRALHDPQAFIQYCRYNGDSSAGDCSFSNFTPVVTNSGVCYTFNGNFPLNCNDTVHAKQLKTTGAGQRFAFTVEVNIDQNNYPPFITDAGVLLEIHPPLVPPRPLQKGVAVPPGQAAYIGLTSSTYTFVNYPHTPPPMDFYSTYNIPTCVLNNFYTRVSRICGCLPPGAPNPCPGSELTSTPSCTLDQMDCYVEAFFDSETGGMDDDCMNECCTDIYSSTISYSKYPAKKFQSASLSHVTSPEENLVVLQVYFEDLIVERVTEEAAYDIIRLLADIGGQLGLFLGVSVVSVTEFLTWTLDEMKDRVLCCKDVRRGVTCNTCRRKADKNEELEAVDHSRGPVNGKDYSNCPNQLVVSKCF